MDRMSFQHAACRAWVGPVLSLVVLLAATQTGQAELDTLRHIQIGLGTGGFAGDIFSLGFGRSLADLGDLDGDGVGDIAVGAADDNVSQGEGSVWVLFMNSDGTVRSHQKIGQGAGGFLGSLGSAEGFGTSLAALGDLDGDGNTDLAVGSKADGAQKDDDGATNNGAVWLLYLNSDGTVKEHRKISAKEGAFEGRLRADRFGGAIAVGDIDGDGTADLLVGAIFDNPGVFGDGAVWALFLNADGSVRFHEKIGRYQDNNDATIRSLNYFGVSVLWLGDRDGDGAGDFMVGSDGFGCQATGTVWFFHPPPRFGGLVESQGKISASEGSFGGALEDGDSFGASTVWLGDVDADGKGELLVGSPGDDDGGPDRGALWILTIEADGTVVDERKISSLSGNFTGLLDDGDGFGTAVASLGDLDGDGVVDVVVGSPGDDDGGPDRGALWVIYLQSDFTVKAHQKISSTQGGFNGTLDDGDGFGTAVHSLGDLDDDGETDLAVGAAFDDDGNIDRAAVWILFLDENAAVTSEQKISDTEGGFTGEISGSARFGIALASPGDLDSDGRLELAVGSNRHFDPTLPLVGAVWIRFLDETGQVSSHQRITVGTFAGNLISQHGFGASLASIGDFDGNGIGDLAVGSEQDNFAGSSLPDKQGAAWILLLQADGNVRKHQKISESEGGFTGILDFEDRFGSSIAFPGDLDGDGVSDLLVGASADDDGGSDRGAVWVLRLRPLAEHGNVNLVTGPRTDVLFVNGSPRSLVLPTNSAVEVSLFAAPLGPDPSPFFLLVWPGFPERPVRLRALGKTVGCLVNPTPFHVGLAPQPFRCLRANAIPPEVCSGIREINGPSEVPFTLNASATSNPFVLTLQAILKDAGGTGPLGFSVSNAVVLEVR